MRSHQESIIMPWHAAEPDRTMIARVSEAATFASWLHADLCILLTPKTDLSKISKLEAKLSSILPRETRLIIETSSEEPATATLGAVQRRSAGLVLLAVEPHKTQLEDWQNELIGQLHTPVLLVPKYAKLGPVEAILVPLQGEKPGEDSGLDFGIELATRHDLPLDILHVTPKKGEDHSLVGEVSDSYYHDYPNRINEMITQASPLSSDHDRSVIRMFLHVQGDTASEITRSLFRYKHGLIVLQWKGSFAPGRADMVHAILRASPCPVLLIRPIRPQESTLDLGSTRIAS